MDTALLPYPQVVKISPTLRPDAGFSRAETSLEMGRRVAAAAVALVGANGEQALEIRPDPTMVRPDEYRLDFAPERIQLTAAGPVGAFYGIQTLRQMIRGVGLPTVGFISDWADIPMRIQHIDLKRLGWNYDYLCALPARLAELKINFILLECEDKFQFDFYDQISVPSAFTPDQWRNFGRIAHEHFIEVMPLVQCLGHLEYVLRLPRYAELRENPENSSQACPLHPGTLELFQRMAGEIMAAFPGTRYFHIGGDEPFLLGTCPRCAAVAAANGKGALYADYLNRALGWVRDSCGKIPVFWADIVLAHPEAATACSKDAVAVDWNYKPLALREKSVLTRALPGGNIDAEKYRQLPDATRIRVEKYLEFDAERGDFYSLPGGPLLRYLGFTVFSASHVARADNVLAHSASVCRHGLAGHLATYWASADSLRPPYTVFETRWPGIAMLGASAWNCQYETGHRASFYQRLSAAGENTVDLADAYAALDQANALIPPNDNNRNGSEYFKLIAQARAAIPAAAGLHQETILGFLDKIILERRLEEFKQHELAQPILPEHRFRRINLQPWVNEKFSNTPAQPGWTRIPNNDLRDFPQGDVCFLGVPFQILEEGADGNSTVIMAGNFPSLPQFQPAVRGIRIGCRAAALHLVHSLVEGKANLDGYCGKYVIHYHDGTVEETPLYLYRQIGAWWRILDAAEAPVAWSGVNQQRVNVGLHLFNWFNKRPDVEIVALDIICEAPALLCLAGVTVSLPAGAGAVGQDAPHSAIGKALDCLIREEQALQQRINSILRGCLSADGADEAVRVGFEPVMHFLSGLQKICRL
ncbi:MAG: glycoside hydrolase family 20 zincin-like fold domain-containing protein [Kiritimatiellia bacterium]|jgi:hypothetical protein